MPEQNAQPAVPRQWRVENVKDNSISFDCPACKEHYQFDAKVFAAKSTQNVEGLVKTDQFVRRTYGQNFLAIITALIVYYYAHQWINGEGTPLNQGILIPVFIAVAVYSILKPFFSAGLFSGKGIPIYTYDCASVIPMCLLPLMENQSRYQCPPQQKKPNGKRQSQQHQPIILQMR